MQFILDFFESLNRTNKLRGQFFKQFRKDIAENNFNTMRFISFMAVIVLAIMLIFSEVLFPNFEITIEYQMFFLALIAFVIFTLIYGRKRNKNFFVVQTVSALFCLVVILFCGAIDIFPYPESPASFFPLVLVVIQVLFIFSFRISYSMLFASEALYVVLTLLYKNPRMAKNDIFNSVAGILFAFVVSWVVMKLRVSDNHEKHTYLKMSSMDELTGVLNKVSCEKNVSDFLDVKPVDMTCALLIIDIDNFKNVNDKLGHQVGDVVLQETGALLCSTFRNTDIIGRIGGDEFMVLMPDISDERIVVEKCDFLQNAMINRMRQRIIADITFSIGIVMLYDMSVTLDKMYQMADDALYEAKSFGKCRHVLQIMRRNERKNKGRRVMIVADDDETSRTILKLTFEKQFSIVEAGSGSEALSLLSRYREDTAIILLDIMMPGMDGYQLLKYMRERVYYSNIPVIVITGDEKNEKQALAEGADDVIIKPVDPAVAKLRVTNVLKNLK